MEIKRMKADGYRTNLEASMVENLTKKQNSSFLGMSDQEIMNNKDTFVQLGLM